MRILLWCLIGLLCAVGVAYAEPSVTPFETINWATATKLGATKISLSDKTRCSKFKSTSSKTFAGAVSVVPTTGTGGVTRMVWISATPGGPALNQTYLRNNIETNRCSVSGVQLQLNWTQEETPTSRTVCKLLPSTVYYLNYKNKNCSTSDCPLYRSIGNNGKP
jgi:hypothetical protein